MRKLWKATATLAAAVLLAGSLAGCGSSGGSSSSFGGGKSGSTSDMIVTTMNTEAGSLDSAERAVYGGGPTMMCVWPRSWK
mgnify:CR=1 FL=1